MSELKLIDIKPGHPIWDEIFERCGPASKRHATHLEQLFEAKIEIARLNARASSPDPAPLTPNRLDLAGRIYGLQEACVIAGQTSIGMAIYERIKFIEANTGEPRPDPAREAVTDGKNDYHGLTTETRWD